DAIGDLRANPPLAGALLSAPSLPERLGDAKTSESGQGAEHAAARRATLPRANQSVEPRLVHPDAFPRGRGPRRTSAARSTRSGRVRQGRHGTGESPAADHAPHA